MSRQEWSLLRVIVLRMFTKAHEAYNKRWRQGIVDKDLDREHHQLARACKNLNQFLSQPSHGV